MNQKSVTAIIPTYKPDERFDRLICALREQTLRPEKIIVINTGREFFRPQAVEGLEDVEVRHIRKEEFDHAGTRDMGARMASSELILFMTMDAVPADRYMVEKLAGALEDPKSACAYARQLCGEGADILERFSRDHNYPDSDCVKDMGSLKKLGIKTYFCSNVCAMYRADIYRRLGGFKAPAIFNEDMVFAAGAVKAGYRIRYAAEAGVVHWHNLSCSGQFHRNFDLGVSQAMHPEIFNGVPSEGEGLRYVKDAARFLIRKGRPDRLPALALQSFCKYTGYRLGKSYRKLPRRVVLKLTMNSSFWDRMG